MVWARRALASLLTLVLFLSLVAVALSTGANSAFAKPQKVEGWLNDSNLYQRFLDNAIQQAKISAGSSEAQGSVTLSDAAVQQAANNAFTNSQFQQDLNTFLDSNYAWLEGKTATPTFTIDLTKQKQSFAQEIGQYVTSHINSLPVCTTQQLIEIGSASNIDPLNVTCRPPTLDASAEGGLVAQKIESSGGFLAVPVVTANNINPNGGSQAEPYYQKFSSLPTAYQAAVKLPWVYGVVAAASALGVVFASRSRRNGWRAIAGTLLSAGVVLIVIKLLADTIVTQAEKHIFNQTNVGQLQQSLTHFFSLAEQQVTKIDFWFGVGYIALATIIFLILVFTHRRKPKASSPKKPIAPEDTDSIAGRMRTDAPHTPAQPQVPPREEPTGPPAPPKKRPTKLIQ